LGDVCQAPNQLNVRLKLKHGGILVLTAHLDDATLLLEASRLLVFFFLLLLLLLLLPKIPRVLHRLRSNVRGGGEWL